MKRISKKFLVSLYQSAPVPVVEHPIVRDFALYYPTTKKRKAPYIVISSSLENYQKVAAFFHELGHSLCARRNCYCQGNKTLEETHALSCELTKCLGFKSIKPLLWSICTILHIMDESDSYEHFYVKAANRIINKEIWKKCKKAINQNYNLFCQERKKYERRTD